MLLFHIVTHKFVTNAPWIHENEVKFGFVIQTRTLHETRNFADKVFKHKIRAVDSAQFPSHAQLFTLT